MIRCDAYSVQRCPSLLCFSHLSQLASKFYSFSTHVKQPTLKDKSKVWGDFLTRFPLKFAENNDVGEIVI